MQLLEQDTYITENRKANGFSPRSQQRNTEGTFSWSRLHSFCLCCAVLILGRSILDLIFNCYQPNSHKHYIQLERTPKPI